jgi:hypothetical protein
MGHRPFARQHIPMPLVGFKPTSHMFVPSVRGHCESLCQIVWTGRGLSCACDFYMNFNAFNNFLKTWRVTQGLAESGKNGSSSVRMQAKGRVRDGAPNLKDWGHERVLPGKGNYTSHEWMIGRRKQRKLWENPACSGLHYISSTVNLTWRHPKTNPRRGALPTVMLTFLKQGHSG